MNTLDIRKIRPMPKDKGIVVVRKPRRVVESEIIHIAESPADDDGSMQYFEIIAVGDEVTLVSVGDVCIIDWKDITQPENGLLDGEKRQFGITEEKKLIAVVDIE